MDRLIDIKYVEKLQDIKNLNYLITPKPDWKSTIIKLGNIQATKYTLNNPHLNTRSVEIYNINLKTGGLQIEVNTKLSELTVNQILSTFRFINDETNSCVNDLDCGINICDCKADLEKIFKL
jgi:hypothetical protein